MRAWSGLRPGFRSQKPEPWAQAQALNLVHRLVIRKGDLSTSVPVSTLCHTQCHTVKVFHSKDVEFEPFYYITLFLELAEVY
jgi:hypothetical protein